MAHSRMLPAVISTVILYSLSSIISHHLVNNAFDNAGNSELWLNITSAFERIENATAQPKFNVTISNTTAPLLNATAGNSSSNATSSTPNSGESFYWKTLPQSVFILALLGPLMYYWQLWLERILPGRARVEARLPPPEKADFGDDGDREQEVIEKWIAQGKIKRSSLSWWNTFLKWIVHCTIGSLWMVSFDYLVESTLYWRWPLQIWKHLSYWEIFFRFLATFFSTTPLASLIAFILIPAHKRMAFEAGADLFWSLFFGVFLTTVLPLIASNSYVQTGVAIWIEGMENQTRLGQAPPPFPRLGDEL